MHRVHPAANLMPPMPADELNDLTADIRKNGLISPIELLDGKIIDGRHRLKACEAAGVDPEFVEIDLGDMSPEEYVWALNGLRRHLTATQRACCAAELLPALEAKAKERLKTNAGSQRGLPPEKIPEAQDARDEAAKVVGVNPRYVSDAKAIKEKSPDLYERMKSDELTISQAKRQLKKQEKREELAEKAKKAKKVEKGWDVILGDVLGSLSSISGARLVFADPPYNIGVDYGQGQKADQLPDEQYLTWCEAWLSLCVDALTDDGSLWLLVPDNYAEHFAVILNKMMYRRAWVKWYETFGVNCSGNFNRTSRHIFYYVRDRKRFVFNEDAVSRPSDRQAKYNDKRAAEGGKLWDDVWQIPRLTGTSKERMPDFPTQLPLDLVLPIVGCASDPGDLVVDPFSGSGTTGVACKQLGRRFIGIEREESFWEASTLRIAMHESSA